MAIRRVMDKRNELLSYPLRKAGPYILEGLESDKPHVALAAMGMAAYAAAPTFIGNVLLPAELITSGIRPQPINLGLSHYRHHFHVASRAHWMEPVFEILHGSSKASKFGQKLGGKVGAAKLGGKIGGRFIPGVGWALLAYDVYDIAVNRSLWGFDLS